VWQDFLFACGDYPASPDFISEVKVEDEGHLKRVGHHASMYSPIWLRLEASHSFSAIANDADFD
jgi:hypothetical protein